MSTVLEFEKEVAETTTHAGQCIAEYRVTRGRTIKSIASVLNLSVPYLCQIERGVRVAPADTLWRIAKELRIEEWVIYAAYMKDTAATARKVWVHNRRS